MNKLRKTNVKDELIETLHRIGKVVNDIQLICIVLNGDRVVISSTDSIDEDLLNKLDFEYSEQNEQDLDGIVAFKDSTWLYRTNRLYAGPCWVTSGCLSRNRVE